MNEIVWPCNELHPAHQVVVGMTAETDIRLVRRVMKYGC